MRSVLYLTPKHCPPEDFEPATHFPYGMLVLCPSDEQTHNHQTGPIHPVHLVVHVNSDWSLQCPSYENIVVKWGLQAYMTPTVCDIRVSERQQVQQQQQQQQQH